MTARPDLITPEMATALSEVLGHGVDAYGARTWETGRPWMDHARKAIGHIEKWIAGSPCDEDSGRSHLEHAMTRIGMLVTLEVRGVGEDDRP